MIWELLLLLLQYVAGWTGPVQVWWPLGPVGPYSLLLTSHQPVTTIHQQIFPTPGKTNNNHQKPCYTTRLWFKAIICIYCTVLWCCYYCIVYTSTARLFHFSLVLVTVLLSLPCGCAVIVSSVTSGIRLVLYSQTKGVKRGGYC